MPLWLMLAWQDYFMLEPFGEEAAWLRHGIACALHANIEASINRDPKKGEPRWAQATDFMPFSDEARARSKRGAQVTRAEAEASWASFVGSVKKHLKPKRNKEN